MSKCIYLKRNIINTLHDIKDSVQYAVTSIEKEVKTLSEIKSTDSKTNQKAIQENIDTKNLDKDIKAVGGLSELQ